MSNASNTGNTGPRVVEPAPPAAKPRPSPPVSIAALRELASALHDLASAVSATDPMHPCSLAWQAFAQRCDLVLILTDEERARSGMFELPKEGT